MKHGKYIFLALLGFIGLSLTSSDVSPYPFTESSLLWKIEGPGVVKGSHLFGTMHLIEKDYFYFPSKLERILKKSDVLVMELEGLPNQQEALEMVTLKEGTFFDFFSPAQLDTIFVWAKEEMHLDETAFRATMSKMKPFMVVQMATQMHFMGKTESYEMTFERLAKTHKLKLRGLESAAEQLALFDDLSKEEQAELVMDGIRNKEKNRKELLNLQQVYYRQQIDSLYMLIQGEGGLMAEKQDVFLDQRNKNWIGEVKQILAKQRAFIAVGAGHLGGPAGLIRLLQQEGYTLTPVTL
jgi:uncharacterized protein YbaP (TraB family)